MLTLPTFTFGGLGVGSFFTSLFGLVGSIVLFMRFIGSMVLFMRFSGLVSAISLFIFFLNTSCFFSISIMLLGYIVGSPVLLAACPYLSALASVGVFLHCSLCSLLLVLARPQMGMLLLVIIHLK